MRPITRPRLRTRLLAGFGAVLALTVLVAGTGLWVSNEMSGQIDNIYLRDVERLRLLSEIATDAVETRNLSLLHVLNDDPAQLRSFEAEITARSADVTRHLDQIERDVTAEEVAVALRALRSAWDRFAESRDAVVQASAGGRRAEAIATALGPGRAAFAGVLEARRNAGDVSARRVAERHDAAQAAFATGRALALALSSAALALGITIAWWLARRVSRAVGAVAGAAERVAAGEAGVRARVDTGDEIEDLAASFNTMAGRIEEMVDVERSRKEALETAVGDFSAFAEAVAAGRLSARVAVNGSAEMTALSDNLNSMAAGLGALSGRVREGAEAITGSAAEILATVSQHTASAREQSAAINETSATADEVRAAAEQSARRAGDVAAQARASAEVSAEGAGAVTSIVTGMGDIRARVEEIARDVVALSERTEQVGDITTAVAALADQSNLLAVNASIEAAKAGEQGRGFSVVATEMRSLAEQSKAATTQVRQLLGEIQKGTNAAVLATEQGTQVVESGVALARGAGDVITRLTTTIEGSARAAEQIAASAHQQSTGMDQIAQAMRDVGQATSQFVAGAQQSQTAAENLDQLSTQLTDLTARYET